MTTMMPPSRTEATVGAVLATRHEDWMQHVARVLTPALDERADFWSRWAISRYVDDRFADRFRLECALVEALAPCLPPESVRALSASRQAIERAGEELMAVGRRRGASALMAQLARQFVDQLALWCVELELATDRVPTDELTEEAHRLLARLHVADVLCGG